MSNSLSNCLKNLLESIIFYSKEIEQTRIVDFAVFISDFVEDFDENVFCSFSEIVIFD